MALAGEQGDDRTRAVQALVALLEDPVQEVRAQAVEGLAEQIRAGFSTDVSPVLTLLDDDADGVRCAVLANADALCDDPAVHALNYLDDPAPSVRAASARLLGDLGSSEHCAQLESLLADEDEVVRQETALALAAHGDARGGESLVEMLSADVSTAVLSARALGNLEDERFAGPLERMLEGWFVDPEAKAAAAVAADKCGSAMGKPALRKMLSSFRANTRMCVYRALSMQPLPGMVGVLEGMLEKADGMEQSSLIGVLGRIGRLEPGDARAALERLAASLDDEDLLLETREAMAMIEGRNNDRFF